MGWERGRGMRCGWVGMAKACAVRWRGQTWRALRAWVGVARTTISLALVGLLQLGLVVLFSLGQPLEQRRVSFGEFSVLLLLAQGLEDLKFEGCSAASACVTR